MRTRSKLALVGLGAMLLMAIAVNTASAGRLSSSSQTLRVTFNNLELIGEEISTTTCHVTLEGSLHSRSIVKTAEALIGFITRVTTASCNHPVRILNLPWNVRYSSFSGTLPNITLLTVSAARASFDIEPGLNFHCLAEATLSSNFNRNTTTGELTEAAIPLQEVPLRSGGGFGCPVSTGEFRSNGNGAVTVLGAATRITVTLI